MITLGQPKNIHTDRTSSYGDTVTFEAPFTGAGDRDAIDEAMRSRAEFRSGRLVSVDNDRKVVTFTVYYSLGD